MIVFFLLFSSLEIAGPLWLCICPRWSARRVPAPDELPSPGTPVFTHRGKRDSALYRWCRLELAWDVVCSGHQWLTACCCVVCWIAPSVLWWRLRLKYGLDSKHDTKPGSCSHWRYWDIEQDLKWALCVSLKTEIEIWTEFQARYEAWKLFAFEILSKIWKPKSLPVSIWHCIVQIGWTITATWSKRAVCIVGRGGWLHVSIGIVSQC